MFSHEPFDLAYLHPREPTAALQANGVQPQFGDIIVAFDMNVGRLVPITGVEEEPVWPLTQNCRHGGYAGSKSRLLNERHAKHRRTIYL